MRKMNSIAANNRPDKRLPSMSTTQKRGQFFLEMATMFQNNSMNNYGDFIVTILDDVMVFEEVDVLTVSMEDIERGDSEE